MENNNNISQILDAISKKHLEISELYQHLAKNFLNCQKKSSIIVQNEKFEITENIDEINTVFDENNDNNLELIEDYLNSCGLSIQSFKPIDEYPEIWIQLANFIANKFNNINPLLKEIKKINQQKT